MKNNDAQSDEYQKSKIITLKEKFNGKTKLEVFKEINDEDLLSIVIETDRKVFWAINFLSCSCGMKFDFQSACGMSGDKQMIRDYHLKWLSDALKLKDTLIKTILRLGIYDRYILYFTDYDSFIWLKPLVASKYICCLRIVR